MRILIFIHRIDVGSSGGLGYKFKGTEMNLGITYYLGLMDIMNGVGYEQYDYKSKNSAFYVYVNIPIGAGYKEAKQSKE